MTTVLIVSGLGAIASWAYWLYRNEMRHEETQRQIQSIQDQYRRDITS